MHVFSVGGDKFDVLGRAFLYVKFWLQKVAEHRDTCGVAEGPSSDGHPHPPSSDMVQWYINAKIDCPQRKSNVQIVYNSWFLFFFSCFRSEEELHNVKVTHKPPEGFVDKVSYLPNESARKLGGGWVTNQTCVKKIRDARHRISWATNPWNILVYIHFKTPLLKDIKF